LVIQIINHLMNYPATSCDVSTAVIPEICWSGIQNHVAFYISGYQRCKHDKHCKLRGIKPYNKWL